MQVHTYINTLTHTHTHTTHTHTHIHTHTLTHTQSNTHAYRNNTHEYSHMYDDVVLGICTHIHILFYWLSLIVAAWVLFSLGVSHDTNDITVNSVQCAY